MLHNSIIIIPHLFPLGDGCDYILQTGRYLSQNNTVITVAMKQPISWRDLLFSSNHNTWLRQNKKNFFEIRPINVIPGSRHKHIRLINVAITIFGLWIYCSFRYPKKQKLLWFFEPIYARLFLSICLGWKALYDDVDYFGVLDKENQKDEQFLLLHAKHVFVISPALQEKLLSLRSDVHLVPSGFAEDVFFTISQQKAAKKGKPYCIGYVGAIDFRLDFSLLFSLVQHFPNILFFFVGPIGLNEQGKNVSLLSKKLFSYKNVTHIPQKQKKDIPKIIQSFDICLIPLDIKQSFVQFSNPMKTNEYLFMQKPIIATKIPALRPYNRVIHLVNNVQECIQALLSIRSHPMSQAVKILERQIAMQNSWRRKITAIEAIIQ